MGIVHAVSYKSDIEGWRRQIEEGAKALNSQAAQIVGNNLVV
jgi:hypothetical protein